MFNSKGDKVYYSGQLPGSGKNSDYELVLGSAVPRMISENSFGGVWDASADDHWLITHSRKPAPAPLGTSYDDNRPYRETLALVDRDTCQVTPFLSDPNANLYQAHISHGGAWVTFLNVQPQHSQIYIVPFSPREIPRADWIAITDGSTLG